MAQQFLSGEQLLGVLRGRYATKAFDPALRISAGDWDALKQSLVLSQSAFGFQPWKFLVIENADLRAKLRPFTWGQSAVTDADKFVVFLAQTFTADTIAQATDRHLANIAATRKVPVAGLAGFRARILETLAEHVADGSINEWARRQVYIALGQFTTAAALLGIDTCPIEGLDKARYDELLGLAGTPFTTVVTAAVGYRSASDAYAAAAKVRFPLGEVVEVR